MGFAVRIIVFSTAIATAPTLLARQTAGARPGADQVFVSRHGCFSVVPPAVADTVMRWPARVISDQ